MRIGLAIFTGILGVVLVSCQGIPKIKVSASIPGKVSRTDFAGLTPNLPSYVIGNSTYTPKPGYKFVALFFKVTPLERKIRLIPNDYRLYSTEFQDYYPQFDNVGIFDESSPRSSRELMLVYVVPSKAVPKYVQIPEGIHIQLEEFFGGAL